MSKTLPTRQLNYKASEINDKLNRDKVQDSELEKLQKLIEGKSDTVIGFSYVDSLNDLPLQPTDEQKIKAWILPGNRLYVFVGINGDVLDAKYKYIGEIRGPKGDPGEQGITGPSGDTSAAEAIVTQIRDAIQSMMASPDTDAAIVAQVAEHTVGIRELGNKITEQEKAIQRLNELFGEGVEGYVRVSGVSDPAMKYREFKHTAGTESVFDCIKPCLVGNNFTGRVGEILHVLDPMNWYKSEDGRDVELDSTHGEVMVCNTKTIYIINGHVTVSNIEYDVFLRSYEPFEWYGHAAEKIDPMGWSPSYVVAHTDEDSVVRFHSCYNPSFNGSYATQQGMTGKFVQTQAQDGSITETYYGDRSWFGSAAGLSSTGISLPSGEQYAMNLNDDKTKPYPFYNRTARCEEIMFGNMLSEGGTFDVHKFSLFGSGFSSNDSATSEVHWSEGNADARNGFRYVKSDGKWEYYSLGSNADFGYGATGDSLYKACMINSWRTPWKCLEQQLVMMYAIENNIPELTWFVFDGNKYKWRHVDGFAGPSQGVMTCVVWKHFSSKLVSNCVEPGTTKDVSGNRCEFLISSAMYRGVITDVSPSWWTSGLIFTEDENGLYDAYMQRDQTKLIKSESGDKIIGDMFNFENEYTHIGQYSYGNGYRKTFHDKAIMLPSDMIGQTGGALHSYVCGYNYFSGTKAPAGKKSVRGFRRGNYALSTALSPFYVHAYTAPSSTGSYIAFGTCVMLTNPSRSV